MSEKAKITVVNLTAQHGQSTLKLTQLEVETDMDLAPMLGGLLGLVAPPERPALTAKASETKPANKGK